ncbi:hypothetical protein [Pseudomonas gingeri]|uniref:hypothetical protein n=1 Tax=Pseudomonas gingeri TaxID=117681 RepID=UPI0035293061
MELILGVLLEGELNGNYTHCKNIRRLHLEISGGDRCLHVQLDANRRVFVPKEHVDSAKAFGTCLPVSYAQMTGSEKGIYQRWLAARYRRSSFPDEFDRRLKEQTKVADRLAKCFKDSGKHIPAVFFDVDFGSEKTRAGEDDLYELTIYLLYATDEDPALAEAAAREAAEAVQLAFQARCTVDGVGKVWKWIELIDVVVLADESLSYAQSLLLNRWQADHISLRTDPAQPIFDVK